ncbi:NgoBV family restriction endonuclease, partial [Acinetobacter sp. YH01011]
SPNFDLANFDAFTRSLLTEPERLDTDHLVFEYELFVGGIVRINNIWIKKIWEMAGPSTTNILNLQVKQGVPVNIRPKNWRTNSSRVTFFGQRLDFVIALDQALQHFYPARYPTWLNTVQSNYLARTGHAL